MRIRIHHPSSILQTRSHVIRQSTSNKPPPRLEFWERLEICQSCPKGSKHVKGFPTVCTECGCLIQAKAMFDVFHCPIGKW